MSAVSFALDDQVALITGGGSGIGQAAALALAAQGAQVVVTELAGRRHLAEAVVQEITERGGRAMALTFDVKATLTISHVMREARRQFGRLDILVNNAGTQLIKAALDIDEEEFDDIIDVNLKGAFMCSQAAAAIMKEQRSGCIINIGSQHGVVGNRSRAPYCASKGGLINLTRALAIEWAEFGIRVNAVSPTFVVTDANRHLLEASPLREEIALGVPLGRAATALEVAGGICYLASPVAAMVTGHNLMIDGGWTAR